MSRTVQGGSNVDPPRLLMKMVARRIQGASKPARRATRVPPRRVWAGRAAQCTCVLPCARARTHNVYTATDRLPVIVCALRTLQRACDVYMRSPELRKSEIFCSGNQCATRGDR